MNIAPGMSENEPQEGVPPRGVDPQEGQDSGSPFEGMSLPDANASPDNESNKLETGQNPPDHIDLSEEALPGLPETLESSLKEHNVGDDAENSELLKSVEKVIGDGAGISWHYAEPQVVDNPEAFKKYTEPYILPGRTDVSSFLYFGGLTASGYPWRDFATKLFERSGWHTEVYPLAGHDGRWANLRDTSEREWIEDIRIKAQSMQTPPVVFCYSTSLPAAFEVERRHPGTFRAIIGVGGPFYLKNEKLETYLSRGLMADRIFRIFTFGQFSPLRFGSVPMRFSDDREKTKYERRSPSFERLPVPTALSLRRIQLLGRKAAAEVECPFFYAQGDNDEIVHKKTLEFLEKTVGSDLKECRNYSSAAHGVMLSHDRRQFFNDVTDFMQQVFMDEPAEKDIPDFKTRIPEKAAAYLVHQYLDAIMRRHVGTPANDDDLDDDSKKLAENG